MIRVLISIATILLVFVSYYLFKKQSIFFVLIEPSEKNQAFLQFSGVVYAFLGALGLLVIFFNQRMLAFLFLIVVILASTIFSISFAKKISATKQ
ncbi:hypothetical protein [Candidatus Enterococcus courvalinii]|uniref:Integral membrane protein n=1 Tax=Candidatus Enterococcus courvalinii TaxID=2815329 RepID=A0ABS3HWM1_9ENTE|nr:hypothetical protein [Enterococcus sp. MSG2901]MBO0480863.1 hypothetical protein [Enterococcus sp. MSG2901]